MARFGVTWILGFADYLKRLAAVAAEQGLTIGEDIAPRAISCHLGLEDRDALSALWGGAAVHDWYGVGDTGLIAGEGPDHDGLYVMEDAHYLEILDIDDQRPVAAGESGDMVTTVLFKDDLYPIIRFNTHDLSRYRLGQSSLGLSFERIDGFLGRSDNMVKLKGINIFPQAFAPILEEEPAFTGEFICRAWRDPSGREGMTVDVECGRPDDPQLIDRFQRLLQDRIGIGVDVVLRPQGALAPETGIESRQKPIRLIDLR
jgi:phenylacetate-CoA ligase